MKKLFSLIAVFAIVLVFIAGCATFQKTSQPTKVEMIELTELLFRGEPAGLKAPAVFGDFSTTHGIGNMRLGGDDIVVIEYYPISDNESMYFMIVTKMNCPEPVALFTYNIDTDESTYWIYNSEGQAWQVDKEKYDYFLTLDHPCTEGDPEKPDATLSI